MNMMNQHLEETSEITEVLNTADAYLGDADEALMSDPSAHIETLRDHAKALLKALGKAVGIIQDNHEQLDMAHRVHTLNCESHQKLFEAMEKQRLTYQLSRAFELESAYFEGATMIFCALGSQGKEMLLPIEQARKITDPEVFKNMALDCVMFIDGIPQKAEAVSRFAVRLDVEDHASVKNLQEYTGVRLSYHQKLELMQKMTTQKELA